MSKLTKSVVKSDATSSHDSPLKIQFLLGLRDLTNDNDLIWTCVHVSICKQDDNKLHRSRGQR